MTRHSEAVLSHLKALAVRCHAREIILDAHIDAAEARNSHGLDKRRAETVRDYLVDPGSPRLDFSLALYGDRNPIVATGAGTAEPQNRVVFVRVRD